MTVVARASLVALCLWVGACSKQASPPATDTSPQPKPASEASASIERTASAPIASAETVPPAAKAGVPLFAFTAKDDALAEHDPRIVRWEDGPCGATPYARVARIPLDDAVLLPDFVVEFDEAGKEVLRWGRPYEAVIAGLDGDRLLFRADDATYATDTRGTVTAVDSLTGDLSEQGQDIACPVLPTFAGSDYVLCRDVADRAGRHRRLAWEGPCT